MNILFISNSGDCLPIANRIRKEGMDITIYIHDPSYKKNYDGMGINKISLGKLKTTVKNVDIIIFDINKTNDNTKEDRALLKIFKCSLKSPTLFGPISDKIKQLFPDKKVIGCSTFTEELEMNRKQGSEYAKKLGFDIPETLAFDNLLEGIEFLKKNKELWVFKLDDNRDLDLSFSEDFSGELINKMSYEYQQRIGNKVKYILQKKVDGVEISTEGWFDGEKFVYFNHTIEDKHLMNANLGPRIGSQNNVVWVKKNHNGLLCKEIRNMEKDLKQAKYIGAFDFNCIISKDKKYFLETTGRYGYDAIYNLLTLLKGSITDFLVDSKGHFKDGFASSQRITIPPFPYNVKSLLRDMAKDVLIEGYDNSFWMEDVYFNSGIRCAGSDGILGVIVGTGKTIDTSVIDTYSKIKKLKIGSYLQYRTDLGRRATKAISKLQKMGYEND